MLLPIANRLSSFAPLVLLAIAVAANGQSVAPGSGPQVPAPTQRDPLNAAVPVPPFVYRSALAEHKRYGEVPVASWQQANETVNRIGGWRVYAREASLPDATAPSAAASAPSSAPAKPAGHAGHGKQ